MHRRFTAPALLFGLFAVALVLTVRAGLALAWQSPTDIELTRLDLNLPCCAQLDGTDAGLIVTPAGDQ